MLSAAHASGSLISLEYIGVAGGVNNLFDAGILDIVIAGRVLEVCGAKQFHQLRVAKLNNEFVRTAPAINVEGAGII